MKLQRMTDEKYFAIDAVNASLLKAFAKSPAHAKAYTEQTQVRKKAFDMGTLAHSLILEGESAFDKLYKIKEFSWAAKAGKEEKAEFAEHGYIPVTYQERQDFLSMHKAVKAHKIGKHITGNAERAELVLVVDCPITGLKLKCKFDYLPETGNLIFDLKTCREGGAHPKEFKWAIKKLGYDIQEAHYKYCAELAKLQHKQFVFVAVEKVKPFATGAYVLSAEAQEFAANKYKLLLTDYANCKEMDDFSRCYSEKIEEIDL